MCVRVLSDQFVGTSTNLLCSFSTAMSSGSTTNLSQHRIHHSVLKNSLGKNNLGLSEDIHHLLKMAHIPGPSVVLRRALQYLKVLGIILQIPFLFFAYIILNTLKRIAPNLLFKFITSNILSKIRLQSWKNFSNLSSVDDLDFLFSVDIFKVWIF